MATRSLKLNQNYRTLNLHEDWVAFSIGWLAILVTLVGCYPTWPIFSWHNLQELFSKVLALPNLLQMSFVFVFFVAFVLWIFLLKGLQLTKVIFGFSIIFLITIFALIIGSNAKLKYYGLEPVIFSLIIGLLINNIFKVPQWLKNALHGELFTKIGLVILGTTIIFEDIIKSGALGLIQAVVVVISVWYFAYWICKKLKIDNELAMMLSSAVSICGVSAAIATAGAIKGDSKKLSYVISLVMLTALPMIIIMPYLAKLMGLSEEVTGAWLGGSIDTSGAVAASGTLAGETALRISAIIKFSQNILLGIAAFLISVFWTYTKKGVDSQKPTLGLIWERFPKFVIGFIISSLVFSFILDTSTVASVKDILKHQQSFWFAMAFTCIGLETNIKDLVKLGNGKPVVAFLVSQLFNVLLTLVLAYFLFR